MSWSGDVDEWVAYQLASGAPATTVGLRRYHVRRAGRELHKRPDLVTLGDLTRWLAGKDWAPNTRRAYRASLRGFYAWAMVTGRVSTSPAHLLPPVPIPRARPRPTPEEAYRLALGQADDRVRLAILLAGRCGLRRGEVAGSKREHLEPDLTGWTLRVIGKGRHVRLVPVPDEVARMIRAAPAGWLFPSAHGGHLTPGHLGKLVSEALPGDLTMHTLRHRCGTVAYAATKDLRAVQELLGHAKSETTDLYTQVPRESIRAAMEGAA